MTKSKPTFVVRPLGAALFIATMAGCSSVGSILEPDRIDYKSAAKAENKASKLEVPPDLTQLQAENRYTIPENSRGVATASGYNAQRAATGATSASAPAAAQVAVAPKQSGAARIERDGKQRWLVVNQPAEALWPRIKDFWQENGFLLALDSQETGVMETDWAENRAKIPQDFIRRTIGKVFDSAYSTGERDKFRTRIERNADGSTEVYISHRGAVEELAGAQKERSVWTVRPSDPDLEAEFLGRLLANLTATEPKAAKAAVESAAQVSQRARLVKEGAVSYVAVDEAFDRAWRRVGLALDRSGFTVEDRDRSKGIYFVRYIDQAADADSKASEPGFFSRMFGGKEERKGAQRYRIQVSAAGDSSRVSVLDEQGAQSAGAGAARILGLLNDQLK